jgi:Pyruvate/2-oxoacid:ferredoxin oxidoreductase delta subunit
VNIPKFKTHDFTLLTGAVKNLFGLVPGTYKTELHKNYSKVDEFSRVLVDIYEEAKPILTVIDGIVAMEADGPGTSGKMRNLGLLLAGSDCVSIDSILARIMGIKPFDVLSTYEAAKRGLGIADLKSIRILGEKLEDVIGEPFILPSTSIVKRAIPQPMLNLVKKMIRYYPYVEYAKCIRCSACISACPGKAIAMENSGPAFDYQRCIACFCCQEACPESAIKIKKSILAKMLGL